MENLRNTEGRKSYALDEVIRQIAELSVKIQNLKRLMKTHGPICIEPINIETLTKRHRKGANLRKLNNEHTKREHI